jgi:carboxyl-terminal processing protease
MYFWVESRKVRPDVGYIRFNLFFAPETLNKAFEKAIQGLRGLPRFCGRLARQSWAGSAGWRWAWRGGFWTSRGCGWAICSCAPPKSNSWYSRGQHRFLGPLAILVDGCSASTSEIFAGGMQDLKRARVFGMRSAGAALPSMFERLPNGDGFQYAIANYISEGGKQLEGAGVIPDETAGPTRRELLGGHDPALDRALAWIESSKN